jgi:hypothetical protein
MIDAPRPAITHVVLRHAAVRLDVPTKEVVPLGLTVEAVVTTPTTADQEPRMDIHKNARTTPHS